MKILPFKNVPFRNLKTLITAFAVISVWWGVWGLLDLYVVHINPTIMYIVAIIIGIIIVLIDDWLIDELRSR